MSYKSNKVKKYRNKNRIKFIKYRRKYRNKNKEKINKWVKESRRKLKLDVLNGYGGKCECCGETTIEFLTLDHIKGGGKLDRGRFTGSTGLYVYLRKNNYPHKDKYRILCWNCNCSIGTFGYCPHGK